MSPWLGCLSLILLQECHKLPDLPSDQSEDLLGSLVVVGLEPVGEADLSPGHA